jgi:hypothetical protein
MSLQSTMPAFPEQDGIILKHIPDFPGYAAGSDGSIWTCKHRKLTYKSIWRKRRLRLHPFGHLRLRLRDSDYRISDQYVHRLILFAFVGPCPESMECCHNNGIPCDNRPENLRWGTRTDNIQDAIKHATFSGNPLPLGKGEDHLLAKLKEEDVLIIRRVCVAGSKTHGYGALAKRFGVTRGAILQVVRRKTWKHI